MTDDVTRAAVTERKRDERQRRKERGEVALSGWLSAEDHAALVAMAREAGMTQGKVVARLIGMRARIEALERYWVDQMGKEYAYSIHGDFIEPRWVRHSDLTAAVGLTKPFIGNCKHCRDMGLSSCCIDHE